MNPITSLREYILSAKEELKKVSWPSRESTVRYSALVIAVSVCVAAFFATLDVGFTKLVDALITQRINARQEVQLPPEGTETTSTPPAGTAPIIDFDAAPIITPTTTGTNQ